MKEKILITGASGFAGKSLAKYLIKKKFKITKIAFKNPKYKKIDLTKKINLKSDFDWIIHTAAYHKIKDFKNNAQLKARKNILMVKNLINFAKERNVKNFIYFSTIDINYSTYPLEKIIYIKSKIFCEKILTIALKKNIFKKLIILRLPAIVSKKSNDNFIKKTLQKLKNNELLNIWNQNNKYNNLVHVNDINNLVFYFIYNKYKRKKILVDCLSSKPIKLDNLIFNLKRKLKSKSKINYLKNKTKFKRIEFNSKTNYKFFSVKKVIDLLT